MVFYLLLAPPFGVGGIVTGASLRGWWLSLLAPPFGVGGFATGASLRGWWL